jgi:dephospho-CoA kinase
MKLVGLGGGIGAGKSTVSELLSQRGAVIVDADKIAREIVEPDGPAYGPLVDRFGEEVLNADRTLNRGALAGIVFTDKEALRDLNAITHPEIGKAIAERIAAHMGTDGIVILDAALLFDSPRVGMVGKMLVDVDPEIAIDRLVQFRGFSEEDARNRVASQMSREDRRAKADFVIDNSGDRDALVVEVEKAWQWISGLPDSPAAESPAG